MTTASRAARRGAVLVPGELLHYLEHNGFSNYIASGGGRDFMRPISREV